MTDEEARTLLELARAALRAEFGDAEALAEIRRQAEKMPGLQNSCGVFVTLKTASPDDEATAAKLRGCIGTMESRRPLHEAVVELARKAAFDDPRFPPLAEPELTEVRISVSAMTPVKPIDRPEEIVVGRDGVELSCPPHRAVFLPQVATEQGWDRETLLRQLSIKAGLLPDGWKDGTLSTFRAEVVGET